MIHQPHLTDAQHRMLKRIAAGEKLRTDRFNSVTTDSLIRKGCLRMVGKTEEVWGLSPYGEAVLARHGKMPHHKKLEIAEEHAR